MRDAWYRKLALERWASEHAYLRSANAPDDWPSAARSDAWGLQPLRHGDHSGGHSAMYAAVNGIRLVTARHFRWTKRAEEQLLAFAWAWRTLRDHCCPHRGMRRDDWVRMVDALVFASTRVHAQTLSLDQPWRNSRPDRDGFSLALERLLVAGNAVLVLFTGANYSVVRGFTPTSLLLFDSGGRRWIRRSSTQFVSSDSDARHQLLPQATLVLRRGC